MVGTCSIHDNYPTKNVQYVLYLISVLRNIDCIVSNLFNDQHILISASTSYF